MNKRIITFSAISFFTLLGMSALAIEKPEYYNGDTFPLVSFEKQEIPIVVIVSTYNNSKWYDGNLYSIFAQQYSNYRVIIIDDCSNDNTGNLIAEYIEKAQEGSRCTLIKNNKRKYKMANLYQAINSCDDKELVVILDGDDWFLDDRVLSYFNELYSSNDIWLTAGGYQEYPSGKLGFCRQVPTEVIENNSFRTYPRTTSQLRTFYAGLFKCIPLEDLFFEGRFFKTTSDVAKMMPMFEMAAERVAFNYRKLYVYNLANTINDHKVDAQLQERSNDNILARRKLKRIDHFIPVPEIKAIDMVADVVAFCESPNKLEQLVSNFKKLKGVGRTTIICNNFKSNYSQYKKLISKFKNYIFLDQINSYNPSSSSNPYIFFIKDTDKINTVLSLNKYIRLLEKTQAYGWQLKSEMRDHLDKHDEIEGNVYVAQMGYASRISFNSTSLGLYRKEDIKTSFKSSSFEKAFNDVKNTPNQIILFSLCQ